ncbi:uncharacterized protein LOC111265004 [Varroa jacobsoni]|uniref:uncharacterized protein LOC111265004 n=1 Tax=Varroa jacobsoni TaxID=62625 RepID=UPI000BF936AB|nr:uncharacterized protein LOC111265004 [Varroa jacobsoni]
MKAFILFVVLVASAHAALGGHGIGLHTGSSVNSRAEDGLGNYKFAYNEKHATGGTFRSEAGNPWGVVGSYGLTDIDGRQRVVNYVADGLGFRASIKTNEPGTAPQAAAATSIATPGVAAIAKTIAAPVALAAHASYAAPVVAKAPLGLGAVGYGHGLGYGHAAPIAHSYGYGVAHGIGYHGSGYYVFKENIYFNNTRWALFRRKFRPHINWALLYNSQATMKAFVVLAALVVSAYAGLVGHGIGLHTGSSLSSRAEDGLGNYKFAYNEKHATGGTFRSEAGNPWGVAGSYGLTDIDGRQRVVNYVADGHGFRASIKTNEPGTAPQAAAATSIATPGVAAIAKTIAAPVALAAHASYAAPVVAKAPLALGAAGYGHGLGYAHAAPIAHGYGYGIAHGAGHYYG